MRAELPWNVAGIPPEVFGQLSAFDVDKPVFVLLAQHGQCVTRVRLGAIMPNYRATQCNAVFTKDEFPLCLVEFLQIDRRGRDGGA